ncbi:DUF4286 family protein [Nocardia miyunensis]|uniref:DUF4286 family protein n=1 Tax=Nocardia miyunensis TaxID=282684 RepID=UPI00082F2218|nr:DUF4286 family protein [Nocardia miyunensis]
MPKYTFVVFTNAVEGQDSEYNEWYDGTHVPDVLAVPGFVSARRFKITGNEHGAVPPPGKYLALYDIETDDIERTMADLHGRAGTSAMLISDTMGPERASMLYEAMTETVTQR